MRKFVLPFLALFTISQGETAVKYGAVLYSGYVNYKDSIRDKGYLGGVYNYLGIGLHHSIEGEIDYTKIKYNTLPDLTQYDISLLYTNYSLKNSKIRAGYHYISSDDKYTDGGHIFTLGYEFYKLYRFNAGIDFNYSYYKDYQLPSDKGLSVFQVNPDFGYYFGNYYRYGSFYANLKGYYISLSDDTGYGKDFYSVEGSLNYYYKKFVAVLTAWGGEQSFAVKNHGFIVYNLAEKYKGGYGFSLKYIINPKISITGKFSENTFRERGTTKDSKAQTFVITLGASF